MISCDDENLPVSGGGRHVDLDAAAVAYAERAAAATEAERHRLRDEFIAYCLPFAGRLASRYRGRGETLEDLDQVARLGLVKAVDRYDPARGSFTSYAVLTVLGELKRHFRDAVWGVHVVRRVQNLAIEVTHARSVLLGVLARNPTEAEIADHLGVPPAAVSEAVRSSAGYWLSSLNAPSPANERLEIGDAIGRPDPRLESVDDRLTLVRLMRLLPEREQRILVMRFFGNHSQAEIAEAIGVSQMQVSRLLATTLLWLRTAMLADDPPPWRPGRAGPDASMLVLI